VGRAKIQTFADGLLKSCLHYSKLVLSSWESLIVLPHVILPGVVGPHWKKANLNLPRSAYHHKGDKI